MKRYLEAIGFKELNTRKKIDILLDYVKDNANEKYLTQLNEEEMIYEYEKQLGEGIGIKLIEIVDKDGYTSRDYFYPYVRGLNYLYHDSMEFEHYSDKEAFACICDENNLGIPLIFHVNNHVEYLKSLSDKYDDPMNYVVLSGLAIEGTILLPIEKNEYQEKKEKKGNQIRNDMIDQAKAGCIEAMEKLTLDDMDAYTLVRRRSKREDVFTIVRSYFMPYTVECDKYSVLGEIVDVNEVKNTLTNETIYYISLICNSIHIEFTIAKDKLTGIPEKGRRFKGNMWLQGEVGSI